MAEKNNITSKTITDSESDSASESVDSASESADCAGESAECESSNTNSNKNTVNAVPRLYDSKYFSIQSRIGSRVTLNCKTCHKTIKGDIRSTGNLISHYSVSKDLNCIKKKNYCCLIVIDDYGYVQYFFQRVHYGQLAELKRFIAISRKLKTSVNTERNSPTTNIFTKNIKNKMDEPKLIGLILDYIIEEM